MTDAMYDELWQFELDEARSEGVDEAIDAVVRLVDILLAKNDLNTLRRFTSMTREEGRALLHEYGIEI